MTTTMSATANNDADLVVANLTGIYLIVWATLGKGSWCRNCKRFGFF